MERQFKYIYQGQEVSKEEFTNVAKEMFKWFENNTINAVDYSSVSDFLEGDYKSKGEINKHLKGVLGDFNNATIDIGLSKDLKSELRKLHDNILERKQKEELNIRIDNIQDKFKKAVDNCVSDGNFSKKEKTTAYKETEGKLFYELDWGFITQMAERMASNKKESKYNLWNWKKPMTPKGIEDLKQATLRHLLAIMDGVYEDDSREFGHLEAISDNMMMINYQLKNNLK